MLNRTKSVLTLDENHIPANVVLYTYPDENWIQVWIPWSIKTEASLKAVLDFLEQVLQEHLNEPEKWKLTPLGMNGKLVARIHLADKRWSADADGVDILQGTIVNIREGELVIFHDFWKNC